MSHNVKGGTDLSEFVGAGSTKRKNPISGLKEETLVTGFRGFDQVGDGSGENVTKHYSHSEELIRAKVKPQGRSHAQGCL